MSSSFPSSLSSRFSMPFEDNMEHANLLDWVEQREWSLATQAWPRASETHRQQAFLRTIQILKQGIFRPLEPLREFCLLASTQPFPAALRRQALGRLLSRPNPEDNPVIQNLLAAGPLSRLKTKTNALHQEVQSPVKSCAGNLNWQTLRLLLAAPRADLTLSGDSLLDIVQQHSRHMPEDIAQQLLRFFTASSESLRRSDTQRDLDGLLWTQLYTKLIHRDRFVLARWVREHAQSMGHVWFEPPEALGSFFSQCFLPMDSFEEPSWDSSNLRGEHEEALLSLAQDRLRFLCEEFGSFRRGGAALVQAIAQWGLRAERSPNGERVRFEVLRPLLDFAFSHEAGAEDHGAAALGQALCFEGALTDLRDYFVRHGALQASPSSALSICAQQGHLEGLQWLTRQGVSLHEDLLALAGVLHSHCVRYEGPDASVMNSVALLLAPLVQGAAPSFVQAAAQLALSHVAHLPSPRSLPVLETLRELGADPSVASTPVLERWLSTPTAAQAFPFPALHTEPLVAASARGHAVLTRWLLEHGAPAKGFAQDGAPLKAVARWPLLRRHSPSDHRPVPEFAQCVTLLGQYGAFSPRQAARIAQMPLEPAIEDPNNVQKGVSDALWGMQEYARSWLQRRQMQDSLSSRSIASSDTTPAASSVFPLQPEPLASSASTQPGSSVESNSAGAHASGMGPSGSHQTNPAGEVAIAAGTGKLPRGKTRRRL